MEDGSTLDEPGLGPLREAVAADAVPGPSSSSVELERSRELLNPLTGELVLASDVAGIAKTVDGLRDMKRQIDTAISAFTEAAIEQSEQVGKQTLIAGGLKIVVSSGTELSWDVSALSALRDAGLPEERLNELVKAVVTWKVDAAVANQISSANREYAKIIEAAKSRVPVKRYISIRSA